MNRFLNLKLYSFMLAVLTPERQKEDFQKIDFEEKGDTTSTTVTNSPNSANSLSNEQTITRRENDQVIVITTNKEEDNNNNKDEDNEVYQNEGEEDQFHDNSKVPKLSYWRIYLLFLNFGCLAWGGPVAQISLLKERLVVKEGWITTARFNRVYGVYQIVPGPEATELAMFFGCLAGGKIGGLLGGFGFITPGFFLILLFSFIYTKIGWENVYFNASFRALQPMVAAMVLRAVHKIGEHSFISHRSNKFNWWLFSFAVLGAFQSVLRLNYFVTLAVSGLAFMFIDRNYRVVGVAVILGELTGFLIYVGLKGLPSLASLGVGVAKTTDPGHIFGLGFLAGSLSFGGAYTTIPFLQAEAVTIGGWMTKQTFLDAIAIGNVLPSPLVMFSTFIGYQGGYVYGGVGYGFLGAVLITIGIFTPCFLFTILGHDLLEKLVRNQFMAAFFDGITGSVVGIIAVTAFDLLKASITTSASLVLYPAGVERDLIAAKQSSLAALSLVLSLANIYS
ncbi:11837_t:CDS:2 [Entrophospora sp. SA101]|nr:11837_t:CDS:2 [Entrophospora sp. SA101]